MTVATKKAKNPSAAPLDRIRKKIDQSIAESQRLEIENTLLDNPNDTTLEKKVRSITENAKKIAERQRYSEDGMKAVSEITKIVGAIDPTAVNFGTAVSVIDQLETFKVQSRKLFTLETGERTKMLAEIRQIQNQLRSTVTKKSVTKNVATRGLQDVISKSFDFTGLIKDFIGGNKVVDAFIDYGEKIYKDSKDSKVKRQKIENEMSQRLLTMARDRLRKTEEEMTTEGKKNADTVAGFEIGEDGELSIPGTPETPASEGKSKQKPKKSNKQELIEALKEGMREGVLAEAREEGISDVDTKKVTDALEKTFASKEFKKLVDETIKNGVVSKETRDLLDKFIRENAIAEDRLLEDRMENKRERKKNSSASSVVSAVVSGTNEKKGNGRGLLDTVSNVAETVSGFADLKKIFAGGALLGGMKKLVDMLKGVGGISKVIELAKRGVDLAKSSSLLTNASKILQKGKSVAKSASAFISRSLPGFGPAGAVAGAGIRGFQFGSFVNDKLGISDRIVEFAANTTGMIRYDPNSAPPLRAPQQSSTGNAPRAPAPKMNTAQVDAVKGTIVNAATQVGVDPSTMLAVAKQESNFNPQARPPVGSASGLYQFLDSTWSDIVSKYADKYPVLKRGKNDPEASALGGALFLKENEMILRKNNLPVNAANLYALHFLGSNGGTKILSADGNADAASEFPSAARANPSVFYDKGGKSKTVAEVRSALFGKVEKSANEFASIGIGAVPGVTSGTIISAPASAPEAPSITVEPQTPVLAQSPGPSQTPYTPPIDPAHTHTEAPEFDLAKAVANDPSGNTSNQIETPAFDPTKGIANDPSGSRGMGASTIMSASSFSGMQDIPRDVKGLTNMIPGLPKDLGAVISMIPAGQKLDGIVSQNISKAVEKARIGSISKKFGEYANKAQRIQEKIPVSLPSIGGIIGGNTLAPSGMSSPAPMLQREDPTFLKLATSNMMTIFM